MYSSTIAAVIINLLSMLLPYLGVQIGDAQLTTAVQTIIAIVTGFYIWYQRTTLQKAPFGNGDVTASGLKK